MEIKCSNAYETTLEANKVFWKMRSRKRILILILLLLLSIFLSVYGALHSSEFSKGESIRSESNVQILTFNNYSNRHVAESIGVVMFLVVLFLINLHFAVKKVFFRKTLEIAKRFQDTGNEFTSIFNIDNVEFKSYDVYMKISWIKFSNYRVCKDFIFIGNEAVIPTITIDKRLMLKSDLDTLYGLFKENDVKEIKFIL